jgi:Cu-processing system permease protein
MEKLGNIAYITFLESIRAKVLYGILLFAIGIIIASSLFGSVSIGDQVKVIKDFGLFGISILCVGYTVVAGSTLLYKELSRRTIYNVMSYPVTASEFVVGKFAGLLLTAVILIIGMSLGLILYVALFEGKIDLNLFYSIYFMSCELMIVSAYVMFFSSIVVTPLLNGVFAFSVFFAGRNAGYIYDLAHQSDSIISVVIYWLLPHLHLMLVNDGIVYGVTPAFGHMAESLFYTVGYSVILLTIATICFNRREFV